MEATEAPPGTAAELGTATEPRDHRSDAAGPLHLQSLSPAQEAVTALRRGHGPVLVLGAPGTGKTTALLAVVARRLGLGAGSGRSPGAGPAAPAADLEPGQLLVLTSARAHGARLRDRLSEAVDVTFSEPAVRTWSSYAFDLIRRARLGGFLPQLQRPPRLLTGPEQDALIGQILTGHAQGAPSAPGWPESLGEALETRGFRGQLREFFDRLSEHGLEPADVQQLGRRHLIPEWEAAAHVYQEYRDLLDLGNAEAFDPAGLISTAAALLEEHEELREAETARLQLIVVDDLQEANPAQYRLLSALGRGRDVLAFAAPDSVVQGFRGARPDFLGRVEAFLGTAERPVRRVELTESFRMPTAVAEAWARVVRRIPVSAGRAGRDVRTDGRGQTGAAAAHLVESPVHEQRYVALRVLQEHLLNGRSLNDIAVIVRHGGLVRDMARHLTQQGVPVTVPPAEVPLKDEPAVWPLVALLDLAQSDDPVPSPELAESLMTSRFGGATALDVRRLRQRLRAADGSLPRRSSSELLGAVFREPELLTGLGREAGGARRIVRMFTALQAHLDDDSANVETALWSLWHASGLEESWRQAALAGGSAGQRADLDLDALLALFQAAERYIDQLPGATIAQFVDYIESQDLPMDSLAGRGGAAEAVSVLTPAAAVGREWDLVLIPGLQEGIWPNTRLRGELLRTGALSALVEDGAEAMKQRDAASRVRAVRADEFRAFAAAASRAREQLVCIAVASEDAQPSALIDLIDPLEADRPLTPVPRPYTLSGLVAHLRRTAEASQTSALAAAREPAEARRSTAVDDEPPEGRDAGVVLGRLAHAGVRGAHPDTWWGLVPSTSTGPTAPPDRVPAVSPSRVQAVLESPLNWFVQAAGGEAAVDFARSLGTLVHSIAEEMPEATGDQYKAELERRWPDLDLPPGWETEKDRTRAEEMLRKLALYGIEMRKSGRRLVGQEIPIDVVVDRDGRQARIKGVIDRVELGEDGRPYVVDLKTGKSKPTREEVQQHPQLGTYQAAVLAGALGDRLPLPVLPCPAGAALVQLGDGTKTAKPQEQHPIRGADDDWATPLVLEAAGLMGAADFLARHDPSRGRSVPCRLPGVCPLCDEGRQVTQP
ncbi:ATP-dependent DNA helicase [Zhihengliuella sp.]|uniref:ATP-dependent helicase n=1 Tax=Zhihengliuella sp. TaxID=1954483 RepID=UPI002811BADC|nr:ATP-dependent DNA helicase [Zhihengliuella sp.]